METGRALTGEVKLKAEFLELLRRDEEFRYTVLGLLGIGDVVKSIGALQEQVADNSKAIRELQEQVAEHTKAIKALQEQVADNSKAIRELQEQVAEHTKAIKALQEQVAEHSKAVRALQEQVAEHSEVLDEHSKVLAKHSESIEGFARSLLGLGARWGLIAEDSFREGMKGLVERHFEGKVERWSHRDDGGLVFGFPSMVEVDLVVRDEMHVLVEVKSSVSAADAVELRRVGELYERVTGVKPKLALVSPYVEKRAREIAKKLGMEVYTSILGERLSA